MNQGLPMRRRSLTCLSILCALLITSGCNSSPPGPQSGLPVVPMKIGSKSYNLEVAADNYSREKGLMERDSMPGDHGMIFVFDDESQRSFWMHNTRIPLDILFLDSNGSVVSIHTMKPYDENTTPSEKPAKYAIELNAGEAAANGVKVADQLAIPTTAPTSRPQ
jgi:uncharacterized membrane protein (UPF0127 family)